MHLPPSSRIEKNRPPDKQLNVLTFIDQYTTNHPAPTTSSERKCSRHGRTDRNGPRNGNVIDWHTDGSWVQNVLICIRLLARPLSLIETNRSQNEKCTWWKKNGTVSGFSSVPLRSIGQEVFTRWAIWFTRWKIIEQNKAVRHPPALRVRQEVFTKLKIIFTRFKM